MVSARLLIAALLMCAGSVLAQEQSVAPAPPKRLSEPKTATQKVPSDPMTILDNAGGSLELYSLPQGMIVDSNRQLINDTVCYTMRSYVVARDSKDSDAVHPTGYSTCQPSSRYRLKRTEAAGR